MERERRHIVLTLRVTEDEDREFRLVAKAEQITLSDLIRKAVRDRAERIATEAPAK